MIKRILRAAAGATVVGLLLSLATPITAHAVPVRDEAEAIAESSAPASTWLSLVVDLWDQVASMFGATEGGQESGNGQSGQPPEGENDPADGESTPGTDPNG